MTLSPAKNLSVSYAEEFVFQIEWSILQSRNLMILEWMERIEDETSGWSSAFEREFKERESDVFIDLTLKMRQWCIHRPTLNNDTRAWFVNSEL